ncbi:MAG: 4-hydroxy-3-methylbut-2-enyl diphosphate reductase [Acidimicrobiia bacterium]|nr:4-hydroxy-3-methylbut-2-enyl diphosphate reductase [Acidimicrobiia bacterium]MBT8217363.1 4-hydroxy-3-methylbut-2-enyl diphosphate reductase [Acidimicrobiia bacterium]NNF10181.1 4-hydroxy-3-methylbut-2-enyl diphosphate reductase [Acidimicrobiia bacterium]NNL69077.1 4-hydroxy-3-methylbut-2-enyl diphosphate reductase [Acidimicrobiia bacterium]
MTQKVLLAEPRGFCAGVEMAIKALTWMVQAFEPPVYCYHEIVHNQAVVQAFEAAGVVFVDDIDSVPPGAPVMLSAHGSAPEVVARAGERAAVLVDAVCPLVTKVHHEVRRMADQGYEIIYVGHEGHDEAVGTIAEAPEAITLIDPEDGLGSYTPEDPERVALVSQTTLGLFEFEDVLDAASDRFPALWTARKSDLCYATTNRQAAVKELAERSDVVLVVGSENSSNTQALVRVAATTGTPAHRVDGPSAIDPAWLEGADVVGVTAGASAPDQLVFAVIEAVAPTDGVERVRVTTEGEYFPLPRDLRGLLGALQAAVEGGFSARHPGGAGELEHDREWTANEALELLAVSPPQPA